MPINDPWLRLLTVWYLILPSNLLFLLARQLVMQNTPLSMIASSSTIVSNMSTGLPLVCNVCGKLRKSRGELTQHRKVRSFGLQNPRSSQPSHTQDPEDQCATAPDHLVLPGTCTIMCVKSIRTNITCLSFGVHAHFG